MSVRLVNESALGIYVMSWQSGPGRKRNAVSWFEGMGDPALEFYVTGRDAMSPPVAIRNPQRFGWVAGAMSAKARLANFKTFAQRFADEAESDQS
jgi:hypothetical protein